MIELKGVAGVKLCQSGRQSAVALRAFLSFGASHVSSASDELLFATYTGKMERSSNPSETPTTGPVIPSDDRPDSLESAIANYLQRLEEGQKPDPGEYLQAYPQHAHELRSFFRNHHWLGEAPPPTASSLIGTKVGPYEIESEIARGGMGVVYRARQQGLERPVALKLISSGVLAGQEERRRFRIEAEAAARLHHPGIIAIHEIGSWQGYEYFSMPLVDGPTLQKRVDDRVFDDKAAAQLVRDIARAVAYAHRAGIVHRDLKPENVLISEEGRPLVTDFGLAKWHRDGTMITRTGQVLGTPHYMSPEQACGRGGSDATADVYSLGAILYALLTGRPPHTGESAAEVLRSVLQDEPQTPRQIRRNVSAELEKDLYEGDSLRTVATIRFRRRHGRRPGTIPYRGADRRRRKWLVGSDGPRNWPGPTSNVLRGLGTNAGPNWCHRLRLSLRHVRARSVRVSSLGRFLDSADRDDVNNLRCDLPRSRRRTAAAQCCRATGLVDLARLSGDTDRHEYAVRRRWGRECKPVPNCLCAQRFWVYRDVGPRLGRIGAVWSGLSRDFVADREFCHSGTVAVWCNVADQLAFAGSSLSQQNNVNGRSVPQ